MRSFSTSKFDNGDPTPSEAKNPSGHKIIMPSDQLGVHRNDVRLGFMGAVRLRLPYATCKRSA